MAENYIDVDIDWKEVEKKLKKLAGIKKGSEKALKEALNETAKFGGRLAREEIKRNYTIKVSQLKPEAEIKVKKATQRALTAVVYTQGRPAALPKFNKTSPTEGKFNKGEAKTVQAQVKQGGSQKAISKAFAALMPANNDEGKRHFGFYENVPEWHVPKKGAYANKIYKRSRKRKETNKKSVPGRPYERKKIRQLFGPGTSQILWNGEISENIGKEIEKRFDEALDKAIEKVIRDSMK